MTNEEMEQLKSLQEEIAELKAEVAKLNAARGEDADAKALTVLDAMDETTEDKNLKVETLCRWAAARAGAIVIAPLVGTVALMANEVYLVSRIARVYNVKLTERALLAFLGAMGSRMAGNLLTTLIPFSAIQVPVAVGITYSLGRVTQRWLRDGMPSDVTPYVEMFGEWKEKAKEQVEKLKDNPLKNVPLGDETKDFLAKWGSAAKDAVMDAKEKGCELYQNVCNHKSLADELAEEAADKAEEKEVEDAVKAFTDSGNPDKEVEEQVRAAVEDAKKPLE
ncbi:hypothetical protein [Anaeroglobus geminatus]|uniref:DUF697 domain-containing protein n=1 Tax=Anaeroglobus geminatus F0357 TaxID=861450 RepID=G9YGG7_9FIRM|nr:hypothetical protein [Anaeroglobus geminatus]EHM42189.1 hypothetical protein HMPREF0080_00731 [Anaeroglobus geminatus F0357]